MVFVGEDPGQRPDGRPPVHQGVVEADDQPLAPAFQPVDQGELPQGPRTVEALPRQHVADPGEPPIAVAPFDRHVFEMLLDGELGVLDRHVVAQPERHPEDPPTEGR